MNKNELWAAVYVKAVGEYLDGDRPLDEILADAVFVADSAVAVAISEGRVN